MKQRVWLNLCFPILCDGSGYDSSILSAWHLRWGKLKWRISFTRVIYRRVCGVCLEWEGPYSLWVRQAQAKNPGLCKKESWTRHEEKESKHHSFFFFFDLFLNSWLTSVIDCNLHPSNEINAFSSKFLLVTVFNRSFGKQTRTADS